MSRRVGLDASSREVLLDLIYRLSLDDDEGSGKAREREARRERKREKKSRRGDVGDDGGDGDDSDDEARRARARVKEARRAEKERERKEKVLRRALREDRKHPAGGGRDGDADVSHPGLAAAPHPAGAELRLSVTSAGGETKLMSVKRADNLKDFLSAAKAKLKLKKKPLSARMHAPPGPEIADTLRVEPMATVLVSPDPPAAPPSRPEPKPRTSSRGERRPGDEDDDDDDGDGDDDASDGAAASDASDDDDDASVTTRLRDAAAFAARIESSRWRRVVDPATVAAESARLLAASRDPPPAANAARLQRASLPASSARDAILSAVFDSGAAATVITGDTGSGKTTQAPQFVLERAIADGVGAETCIIVAQPRRVAAVSIARRVAEERGERVGDVVGYRVRGESRVSDRTRLVFVTTGVLLRRLAADPELEGVTHVFVDEVHERTADADFLLVLLRRLLRDRAEEANTRSDGDQMCVAPTPRVVLMSATTDAARLSAYFDGTGAKHAPPPPHVHIPGRTFPVEERFVDQYVDQYGRAPPPTANRNGRDETGGGGVDYAALATVVRRLCEEASAKGDEGDGAVLVFLPGAPEIARAESELRSLRGASLVPLHGQLTPKEQQRAFAPPPTGARKIVLATNVAETSLTIPDVTYVVDTGRAKRLTHDPATRLSALREGWCSAASAAQRKGRAGRVRPGVCVRVYSRETAAAMAAMDPPELHTAPLESTVMHAMTVAPKSHPADTLALALDPPPAASVAAAVARLAGVGAVVDVGGGKLALTPLGFHLSRLPVEPRLGKMLVYGCVLGCLPPVLTAAAAMSCKPMFHDPKDKSAATAAKRAASDDAGGRSDHLAAARAFERWRDAGSGSGTGGRSAVCRELRLSYSTMNEIAQVRDQLRRRLEESGFAPDSPAASANVANDDFARCVLVAGLFPNVARVSRDARDGSSSGGRGRGGRGGGGRGGGARVLDSRGTEVSVHPSSVNAAFATEGGARGGRGGGGSGPRFEGGPPEGYLAYQDAVETSRVFLRETTAVPDEAVLLFGGALAVDHAASYVTVATGLTAPATGAGAGAAARGRLRFRAAPETGVLFKRLRRELDEVLARAAADPSAPEATLEGSERGRRVRDVLRTLLPGSAGKSAGAG